MQLVQNVDDTTGPQQLTFWHPIGVDAVETDQQMVTTTSEYDG